jgi:hypothetical protein
LLATFLASFVILTIGVVAISVDQGQRGQTTSVGRQLVNTPSEANTPSELNAGIVGGAEQTLGGTANTPSELNAQARLELGIKTHKLISNKLVTNRIISDGLPASFYDRHQRR